MLLSFPNFYCRVETLHLHVKLSSHWLTAPHFASLKLDLRGFHEPDSRGLSSSLHAASTLKLLHSNWPELELWGFHGVAKKQNKGGSLIFGRKLRKRLGRGCGWDEEITKQTGGFTSDQNLLTGAKQKAESTAGARRGKKTWASFKSQKRSNN